MSWDILKLVIESKGILEPAEDHILIYIAINVNENEGNVAWCTQDFLAEKTGYHISTIKRRCNSLNEKGILTWIKRKRDKGIFKRNHYTINCNVLKEMIKNKVVLERDAPTVHRAIKVGVTMSDNILNNNLTNKLNKPTEKGLTSRQLILAENLTEQYHKTYKNNYYGWTQIYKALVKFLKSNQTEEDWSNIEIGLPSPMEKGWLKKNNNYFF